MDTALRSRTVIVSAPLGVEVHTPPCFWQKVQPQARAGISACSFPGWESHASENEMFPQWHRPWIK